MPATIGIVFLTSSLIISLTEGGSLFNLLTNKQVVNFGLISYSLYLWHWGILSISRWTIGIHWWTIPFQAVLIYIVSKFSYTYVEVPFRKKDWASNSLKTILKGLSLISFSFIWILMLGKPLKGKFYLGNLESRDFVQKRIEIFNPENCHFKKTKTYLVKNIFKDCYLSSDERDKTIFILGDSHTRSFWPAAQYIFENTEYNVFSFVASANPFPSIKHYIVGSKEYLNKSNKIFNLLQYAITKDQIKEGDIILINLRMPYHFGEDWYELKVKDFRYFDDENNEIKLNSKYIHFENWINKVKQLSDTLLTKKATIKQCNQLQNFL